LKMSQEIKERMNEYVRIIAEKTGLSNSALLPEMIGNIIGIFLSLLGLILVCLIIYGGFIWMTAGGNEEKVIKAKNLIKDAVIGTFLVMASYGITYFVIGSLVNSTK
jgi:hypothetical protein